MASLSAVTSSTRHCAPSGCASARTVVSSTRSGRYHRRIRTLKMDEVDVEVSRLYREVIARIKSVQVGECFVECDHEQRPIHPYESAEHGRPKQADTQRTRGNH